MDKKLLLKMMNIIILSLFGALIIFFSFSKVISEEEYNYKEMEEANRMKRSRFEQREDQNNKTTKQEIDNIRKRGLKASFFVENKGA